MKEYRAAVAESKAEPFQFAIVRKDDTREEFTCAVQLPAMPLLDLAANLSASGLEAVAALGQFINDMLEPQDIERFKRVVRQERLGFDELMEITADLIAHTTGRPTKRPSASADGSSRTGGNLRAVAGGTPSSGQPESS